MARTVRTTKTIKAPKIGRPRGRPPGSTSTKSVAKSAPTKTRLSVATTPVAKPRGPTAASPVLKISKDELRAQVEKLEGTVTALRTRSREAVRAAKQVAARIEELEAQVAGLEKQAAKPSAAASPTRTRAPATAVASPPAPKATRSGRGRRLSRERDPGDAVPPGVAVEEAEPMDKEATVAFENLQAHLHPAK